MLALVAVPVFRPSAGSYGSDRRYTPGSPTTSTVQASVQVPNGDDLETMPESERVSSTRMVFCETPTAFVVGDRLDLTAALCDGQYEVRHVDVYSPPAPLPHCRARAVRIHPGEAVIGAPEA